MTEKDKKIQDQQIEIEMLSRSLRIAETQLQIAKDYIRLLEEMVKSDGEARDLRDFEV